MGQPEARFGAERNLFRWLKAVSHLSLDTRCLRTYLDAPEHAAGHSDAVTRLLRLQHIGGQLSSALAHLHSLRIIHRDLSAWCRALEPEKAHLGWPLPPP